MSALKPVELLFHYLCQGDQAVLKCPGGSTGFAKWTCQYGTPQAKWAPSWIYGTETFFDNLSEMSMDFYKPIR